MDVMWKCVPVSSTSSEWCCGPSPVCHTAVRALSLSKPSHQNFLFDSVKISNIWNQPSVKWFLVFLCWFRSDTLTLLILFFHIHLLLLHFIFPSWWWISHPNNHISYRTFACFLFIVCASSTSQLLLMWEDDMPKAHMRKGVRVCMTSQISPTHSTHTVRESWLPRKHVPFAFWFANVTNLERCTMPDQ